MKMYKTLTFLLIFGITYASTGAANPGQICKNESDATHYFLTEQDHAVYCTGLLPDKNRLRLPNQCNEEILDKKAIYLSKVKGILHKHSLALFPHARIIVIDKSQIESFFSQVRVGTALHIVESTFPNITSEMFTENRYLDTLGLHSNVNHTIHRGAFKRLWMLKTLIVYNQSLPELHEDFLTGLRNLKKLVLNKNNLSIIHEDVFRGLKNLHHINLNHNPLKNFTVKLHYLGRIERISLDDTEIMQLSWRIFQPIRCLKSLQLPNSFIAEMKTSDLVYMALAFPNLKCLHWNSMKEYRLSVVPLLDDTKSFGLLVVDTKEKVEPMKAIFTEEPDHPESKQCFV